jgi:SAM-dependent methyltransferase
LLNDLGVQAFLDRDRSLFRRYQDSFLETPGPRLSGQVVEIGADRHRRYERLYPAAGSYMATNVTGDVEAQADVTELPYAGGSLDGLVVVSVLEHVADVNQAWRELERVLRPGGRLLTVVPFLFPVHDVVGRWRLGPDAYRDLPPTPVVDHLVHLGGRLSAVAALLQRPPGVWRRRQAVYKLPGLPIAALGRWDQLDDSPIGIGLVAHRGIPSE